jgi:hypothetical protein
VSTELGEGQAQAYHGKDHHRVTSVDPVRKILAIELGIKPLESLHVLEAFVLSLDNLFDFDLIKRKLIEQFRDIELCLYSILRWTQLPRLDGTPDMGDLGQVRHGYFALDSSRGVYDL